MKKALCILLALLLFVSAPVLVLAAEATAGESAGTRYSGTAPVSAFQDDTPDPTPTTTEATEPVTTEATEPATTEAVVPDPTGTEPAVTDPSTEPTEPTIPTEPGPEPREDEDHSPYLYGYSNGTFRPQRAVTRAELAVILYSLGDYPDGPAVYSDVPEGKWYTQAVNAVTAAGLFTGYGNGTFRPNRSANRQQVAAVLYQLSGLEPSEAIAPFPDVPDNSWAYTAITVAWEQGWISGYPNGEFRPQKAVTRAEVVTMLNRFLGRTPDREAIDGGDCRFFPDVQPGKWYYYGVMEATMPHTAHYEAPEADELWQDPRVISAGLRDGFYCIGGKLYTAVDGDFLHSEQSGSLNGVNYVCTGSNGVCTVEADTLTLASGELILVQNGKPLYAPGSYPDGYYAHCGKLYAAVNGSLVCKKRSGTLSGVNYNCVGSSGVCKVSVRTLTLANGRLVLLNSSTPVYHPGSYPTGFHFWYGSLYAAVGGNLVNTKSSGTLNSVKYSCAGASGICTVQAEVLRLANGELVLLTSGKAMAGPGGYADGFYVKADQLYAAKNGYLVHTALNSTLNGVSFSCVGSSGICTANAKVLSLATGELCLLKNSRPLYTPGSYPNGFYLWDGKLYAAVNGKLVNAKSSGTLNGVSYNCAGASGVCTVSVRVLTLADGSLALLNNSQPLYLPGNYPAGYYCIGTAIYAAQNGKLVNTKSTGTLNGVSYSCAGASGVCTVQTEVLKLVSGDLILVSGGTAVAEPGAYSDGFYVKAGQLYAVQNGSVVHKAMSSAINGVSFSCTGDSGVCTTEDWTKLDLPGIDLTVFGKKLTPEAKNPGSGTATIGTALRAAVHVYEAYFQVEYPIGDLTDKELAAKAVEYGILDSAQIDCSKPVKRGNLVRYLVRSVRGRELAPINSVAGIPDVASSSVYYPYLMTLYKAGVMGGTGTERNADIYGEVSEQELAELLTRLERQSARLHFRLPDKVIENIRYGTSGSGNYPLMACRIGDGKNVMILTFALHGWEDNWSRDGKELVYLADQVKSYLESNYDLVRSNDWSVYILRCVNPDGLYLGTTCNGPGRCTTTYYNANGTLVSGQGIDMNRCFPYNFYVRSNSRNFTGPAALASAESRALANFVKSRKGSGFNICVDTHGWFSQIITSSGYGTVYNAFKNQFTGNSYASLNGASGYFTSWAAYVQGFDSCLLELPSGIYSHEDFLNKGCVWRYENAIKYLLLHYNGPNSTK